MTGRSGGTRQLRPIAAPPAITAPDPDMKNVALTASKIQGMRETIERVDKSRDGSLWRGPLSIRSTRICVHARTCPPSDQRTGEGESLGRDSGAQARLRATALSYFPQKANGTTQNYSKIVLRGTSGKGASTTSMCGARANASNATSTATQSSADW